MPQNDTAARILDATRSALLANGYASLSTRAIAKQADMPVSQIHYHFGSKQQLVLALLEEENRRRLARQDAMYAADMPLWKRWEQACDFLEDDLDSGYVRVLQEMIAAGWSDPELAATLRAYLSGWLDLLTGVADEFEREVGGLGPFAPVEVATLAAVAFLGAESTILLGFSEEQAPSRAALRGVAQLIRALEEPPESEG